MKWELLGGLSEPLNEVLGIIFVVLFFGGALLGCSLVVAAAVNYLLFRFTDIKDRPANSLVWTTGLASLTYYAIVIFLNSLTAEVQLPAIIDTLTIPLFLTIIVPWEFGFGSGIAALIFIILIQVLITWIIIYRLALKKIESLTNIQSGFNRFNGKNNLGG